MPYDKYEYIQAPFFFLKKKKKDKASIYNSFKIIFIVMDWLVSRECCFENILKHI